MIPLEDECLVEATIKPIRILAKVDKTWILDPDHNVCSSMVGSKCNGKKTIMRIGMGSRAMEVC